MGLASNLLIGGVMKAIIIIIIFFICLLIPWSKWSILGDLFGKLSGYCRQYGPTSQTQGARFLLRIVLKWTGSGSFSSDQEFPTFKFYSFLIEDLIGLHRQLGFPKQKIGRELMTFLGKEEQFEVMSNRMVSQGLLQMVAMALITTSFMILSEKHLQIIIPLWLKGGVILWQLIGMMLFFLWLKKLRQTYFFAHEKTLAALLRLMALCETGLPIKAILERSACHELWQRPEKSLIDLTEQLRELLNNWSHNGRPIREEVKRLLHHSWFLLEERQKKFQTLIAGGQLLFSALFLLLGFLAFVLGLMACVLG